VNDTNTLGVRNPTGFAIMQREKELVPLLAHEWSTVSETPPVGAVSAGSFFNHLSERSLDMLILEARLGAPSFSGKVNFLVRFPPAECRPIRDYP